MVNNYNYVCSNEVPFWQQSTYPIKCIIASALAVGYSTTIMLLYTCIHASLSMKGKIVDIVYINCSRNQKEAKFISMMWLKNNALHMYNCY